jgi:copper resistance protein C
MSPRVLSIVLTVALLILVPASLASAHSRLESASPAPEATVPTGPAEIRIWMTQELTLSGNALTVTDADGNRVDNGDAQVDQSDPDRKQLVATLPALSNGIYTVNYTSSSADDGHTFDGSYWFTVEAAAQSESSSLALIPDLSL